MWIDVVIKSFPGISFLNKWCFLLFCFTFSCFSQQLLIKTCLSKQCFYLKLVYFSDYIFLVYFSDYRKSFVLRIKWLRWSRFSSSCECTELTKHQADMAGRSLPLESTLLSTRQRNSKVATKFLHACDVCMHHSLQRWWREVFLWSFSLT